MSSRGGPFAAIVAYTVRVCAPQRRVLLVLPLAGAVLFGLLARIPDEPPTTAFVQVAGAALHLLILPITCLVVGDAVLGAEVRSGVFSFTWLSPVRHATIAAGRWLGGWLIASALLGPAAVASAFAAGAPSSAGAAFVAVVSASAAYLALFVAIGAAFRRPVVWSLALVILVERLLGAALAGIAQLAPAWLAQAVLIGLTDPVGISQREAIPFGWNAVGRLAVIAAAGLALAAYRLARLRPASAAD